MVSKKFLTSSQFISTLLTFFLAFLLPILSYAQLYPVIAETKELSDLRFVIIFNSIFSIVVGGILTVLRYVAFYFNKRTLKRAAISFASALLVLFLLVSGAQLSVIQGNVENIYLFLDFGGVFLLLISLWALFVLKMAYNIVEIKLELGKTQATRLKKIRSKALIPCPNCKYMCRKQWKKCPICESALY